jgi:hypothetical protein
MKNITFLSFLLIGNVFAQTTIYQDALNLPAGSSTKIGDTTIYRDSLGLPAGSAQKRGDTTIYTDSLNLPLGSSKSSPSPFDAFDDPSSPLNYKPKKLDF